MIICLFTLFANLFYESKKKIQNVHLVQFFIFCSQTFLKVPDCGLQKRCLAISKMFLIIFATLALFECVRRATVVTWASVVRRLSVSGFSKTAVWMRAKFNGQLPIHIYPDHCLIFSKFSIFDIFLFFFIYFILFYFLNMGPMEATISKCYSSYILSNLSQTLR